MSDSRPTRDARPVDTKTYERAPDPYMRDETYDARANPHSEEQSTSTAARTGGLWAGMFLPVVILAVIGLVVILYFAVLR